MSAQPVVQVEDLDVYYGTSQILFGVGLSVRQGETMALLGRNGAGKSTTMKAIMGLAPARRGKVTLRGKVVSGLKPHHIARAGLGFVPEDRQIFPEHTVEDNLEIGAKKGRTARTSGRSGAFMTCFRCWSRCGTGSREGCPVVNSRCWRSRAR
jgi:branched-chain amino acid transport system ATP-binding protein